MIVFYYTGAKFSVIILSLLYNPNYAQRSENFAHSNVYAIFPHTFVDDAILVSLGFGDRILILRPLFWLRTFSSKITIQLTYKKLYIPLYPPRTCLENLRRRTPLVINNFRSGNGVLLLPISL